MTSKVTYLKITRYMVKKKNLLTFQHSRNGARIICQYHSHLFLHTKHRLGGPVNTTVVEFNFFASTQDLEEKNMHLWVLQSLMRPKSAQEPSAAFKFCDKIAKLDIRELFVLKFLLQQKMTPFRKN